MPIFAILLLTLLSVPLIELFVLIEVGSNIGAGATIGLVILTAVLGAWLLRLQGLVTLARARKALDAGEIPAVELVEGLILLLTGVLLLTPGFVTDAIGFIALLPGVRRALARGMAAHVVVSTLRAGGPRGGPGQPGPHGSRTFDADYRVEDEENNDRPRLR